MANSTSKKKSGRVENTNHGGDENLIQEAAEAAVLSANSNQPPAEAAIETPSEVEPIQAPQQTTNIEDNDWMMDLPTILGLLCGRVEVFDPRLVEQVTKACEEIAANDTLITPETFKKCTNMWMPPQEPLRSSTAALQESVKNSANRSHMIESVKCVFWTLLLRQYIINQKIPLPDKDELKQFSFYSPDEGNYRPDTVRHLLGFVRGIKTLLALQVTPKQNKAAFIFASGMVEGSGRFYTTGGSSSGFTKRREEIFLTMTGFRKSKRNRRSLGVYLEEQEHDATGKPEEPQTGEPDTDDSEDESTMKKKAKTTASLTSFSPRSSSGGTSLVSPRSRVTPGQTGPSPDFLNDSSFLVQIAEKALKEEPICIEYVAKIVKEIDALPPNELTVDLMFTYKKRWFPERVWDVVQKKQNRREIVKAICYSAILRRYIIENNYPVVTFENLPPDILDQMEGNFDEHKNSFLPNFVRAITALQDFGLSVQHNRNTFMYVGGMLEGSLCRYITCGRPTIPLKIRGIVIQHYTNYCSSTSRRRRESREGGLDDDNERHIYDHDDSGDFHEEEESQELDITVSPSETSPPADIRAGSHLLIHLAGSKTATPKRVNPVVPGASSSSSLKNADLLVTLSTIQERLQRCIRVGIANPDKVKNLPDIATLLQHASDIDKSCEKFENDFSTSMNKSL